METVYRRYLDIEAVREDIDIGFTQNLFSPLVVLFVFCPCLYILINVSGGISFGIEFKFGKLVVFGPFSKRTQSFGQHRSITLTHAFSLQKVDAVAYAEIGRDLNPYFFGRTCFL